MVRDDEVDALEGGTVDDTSSAPLPTTLPTTLQAFLRDVATSVGRTMEDVSLGFADVPTGDGPPTSITAPTELSAPASLYPGGVAVECGGCTSDNRDGRVVLQGVTATHVELRRK